jgi:hypothetical protein
VEKRFEPGQLKSLYQSQTIRNLLIFLPIALISISLVWVGAADAGPLPFQSSPAPPAPPPTDTPPPPAPHEQPAEPPPEQPAEPPPEQPAESPPEQPTEPPPEQPTEPPPEQPTEPPPEAAQEQEEEENPEVTEPARREVEREEPADSGGAIDWALFTETALMTIGYLWLCCGGLALVVLPVGLTAAFFVGRKRLLDSSSGDNPP